MTSSPSTEKLRRVLHPLSAARLLIPLFVEYSFEPGQEDGLPEGLRPSGVRDIQRSPGSQGRAGWERYSGSDHCRGVGLCEGTKEGQEAEEIEDQN